MTLVWLLGDRAELLLHHNHCDDRREHRRNTERRDHARDTKSHADHERGEAHIEHAVEKREQVDAQLSKERIECPVEVIEQCAGDEQRRDPSQVDRALWTKIELRGEWLCERIE